jgi:hypothetical protein
MGIAILYIGNATPQMSLHVVKNAAHRYIVSYHSVSGLSIDKVSRSTRLLNSYYKIRCLIGLAPQQDSHPCWPSLAARLSIYSYRSGTIHADYTRYATALAALRDVNSYQQCNVFDRHGSASEHELLSHRPTRDLH